MYVHSVLTAKKYSKMDRSCLKCAPSVLNMWPCPVCVIYSGLVTAQWMCLQVSCTFVLNVSTCVYVQPSSASNIERNDTLWSRTWIAHWFLGASLTIHSNWFLALLGVRVMAVLMYHLYVYSSPTATGFTIVCGKCIYNTVCKCGTGTLFFCVLYLLYIPRNGTHKIPHDL